MRTRSRKLKYVEHSIDVAIALLLAGFYPDAVCRVAAAAHKELASLAGEDGSGCSRCASLLGRAQVFLVTADLSFGAQVDEEEIDHLLFLSTLQFDALGCPLSLRMQTFRLWYLAIYPHQAGSDPDPEAHFVFPDLVSLARAEQLRSGDEFLRRMTDRCGTRHVA